MGNAQNIIATIKDMLMINPESTVFGAIVIILVGALLSSVKFAVTQFVEKKEKATELEILKQELKNKEQEYTINCQKANYEASEERRKEELHKVELEIKKVELEEKRYELNTKKKNKKK